MKRKNRVIGGPKVELKDYLKPKFYPPNIDYTNEFLLKFLEFFNKKGFIAYQYWGNTLEEFNLPYPDYPKNNQPNSWNFETRLELDGVIIRQTGYAYFPRYDGELVNQKTVGFSLNKRWYKDFKRRTTT